MSGSVSQRSTWRKGEREERQGNIPACKGADSALQMKDTGKQDTETQARVGVQGRVRGHDNGRQRAPNWESRNVGIWHFDHECHIVHDIKMVETGAWKGPRPPPLCYPRFWPGASVTPTALKECITCIHSLQGEHTMAGTA